MASNSKSPTAGISAFTMYTRTKRKSTVQNAEIEKLVFKTPKLEQLPSKKRSPVAKKEEIKYKSTPKAVEEITPKIEKPTPTKNRKSYKKKTTKSDPKSKVEEINGNYKDIVFEPVEIVNENEENDVESDTEDNFFDNFANEAPDQSFCYLLSPYYPNTFYKKFFDSHPLHISRSNPHYYKGLFSTAAFDKIMKENSLKYDSEVDIVACIGGERTPVTKDMKVQPSFVWDSYSEGYSIRMRNPQVYNKQLWALCSMLQEHFSSFVGANMYLTPAGAQGFPAHFDDIDAFILQIEGRKQWRVYKPDNEDMLARFSSPDLKDEDIGDPVMELILESGDLLYLPRGYIHQAMTLETEHSLHLTLSTNQLNTWGDFLQQGLSHALESAIKDDVEFRKTVPRNYMDIAGTSFVDTVSAERQEFSDKFKYLAFKAMNHLDLDQAADAHATKFIHESMPAVFDTIESSHSVHGNGNRIEDGILKKTTCLGLDTKIRFIRKRTFRLVMDEEDIKLFYSIDNSRNCKEEEAKYLEVDIDVVAAINCLFKCYPEYVEVRKLPGVMDDEVKLTFAQQLYDNGFLVTEKRLPVVKADL